MRLASSTDKKISQIATGCLGQTDSKKAEVIRGVITIIPGINLSLIPYDIIQKIFKSLSKHLTEKDSLLKLKGNLEVIKVAYSHHSEYPFEKIQEVHAAILSTANLLENEYKRKQNLPSDLDLDKQLNYPIFSSRQFDEGFSVFNYMLALMHVRRQIDSSYGKRPLRIHLFLNRSMDGPSPIGSKYIYDHIEKMLGVVDKRLLKI